MEWVLKNIPTLASSTIAVLSVLIAITKLLKENDSIATRIDRINNLADTLGKISNDSKASERLKQVIEVESVNLYDLVTRRLNWINISSVLVLFVTGVGVSYPLANWAASSPIWLAIPLWLIFGIIAIFDIGIIGVGISKMYEPPQDKEKNENNAKN